MDVAALSQQIGMTPADRLDLARQERVDLLGRAADELAGVEHGGEVDRSKRGIGGEPVGQVVDAVALFDPGGGGERMGPG